MFIAEMGCVLFDLHMNGALWTILKTGIAHFTMVEERHLVGHRHIIRRANPRTDSAEDALVVYGIAKRGILVKDLLSKHLFKHRHLGFGGRIYLDRNLFAVFDIPTYSFDLTFDIFLHLIFALRTGSFPFQ